MRVAIITHYYNSNNQGGNLQAYALTKVIRDLCNVEVEQLSYRNNNKFSVRLRKTMSYLFYCVIKKDNVRRCINSRNKVIRVFNKEIPHSKKIYTKKNIKKSLRKYDVFIVGSDQVWNPLWCDEIYRLDFVPESKYKMSYAASVGVSYLKEAENDVLKKSLNSFKGISVREQNAVNLLSELTCQKVEWTLDPTLLLSREQWNQICTPRKCKEEYVFAYFLGEEIEQRELVEKFAKLKKLKIVTLPYAAGFRNKSDINFGDVCMYDASPKDFISLIKYAKYVITDSFHATVFSVIFKRDFFVLNRQEHPGMKERINSLLDLFDLQERFCENQTFEYICLLSNINYKTEYPKYDKMLENSYEFIKRNMKSAKKEC